MALGRTELSKTEEGRNIRAVEGLEQWSFNHGILVNLYIILNNRRLFDCPELVICFRVRAMTLLGSVQRLARLSPAARNFSSSALRMGGGWSYRTTPPPTSQNFALGSKVIMTFTWWWIFHGNQLLACPCSVLNCLLQGSSQNLLTFSRSGTTIPTLRSGPTPSSGSRPMTSELPWCLLSQNDVVSFKRIIE